MTRGIALLALLTLGAGAKHILGACALGSAAIFGGMSAGGTCDAGALGSAAGLIRHPTTALFLFARRQRPDPPRAPKLRRTGPDGAPADERATPRESAG